MTLLPPDAVIFDCDGLLLDTETAWTRAETELFRRHGSTFTMEHKRDMIGSSHTVAAGKLEAWLEQPGQGAALIDELHDLVMEEARHDVEPRPGAVELVDALREARIPIAVASNSPRSFLDQVLATAGVADRFAITVAGDEVANPKPAPDIYLEACRRLDAAPGRSVGLEDSPTGAQAAASAGLHVIGVPYIPDMEIPPADVTTASLADTVVLEAVGLVSSPR
ncbi:MAG TPA: HAD family phosphatase [Baekduia sp.]|uniref:HAD family hydrolase n=1 Tax=Baekduia sp. TaxID=2600305 RepID=UPI002D7A38BF|nr:HAD family phosphatase [Baekduia sp.]HET6507165.1 HAD family phosphatase [Baekduia sp.]